MTLPGKLDRIDMIEHIMEEPNFWDSAEKSGGYVKELKNLKDIVEEYNTLKRDYDDIATMLEMGYEENDPSLIPEIEEMLNKFKEELDELRLNTLLSEEYDKYNAILTLHACAGGTESCDWASMLCRMYQKWADKKDIRLKFWTFWMGKKRGLNLLHCKSTD